MSESNPFFSQWKTPHGIPPFEQIKESHYLPAFEQGLKEQEDEVAAILSNSQAANFINTIEALEASGELLDKVLGVFFNLTSSNTNEEIQNLEQEIYPLWVKHRTNVFTNSLLYARVKEVDVSEQARTLTGEAQQLLKETLNSFLRAGAGVSDEKKAEIRRINEELSSLTTIFGQNVLKDSNDFELIIEDESDLQGLPDSIKEMASEEAVRRDQDGKYLFTISRSSITPFLQYADNRELREKIYSAYTHCGNNDNEFNNQKNAARITALRAKRAKILGFATHADFMLDDRMAKTPAAVNTLLDRVWSAAQTKVSDETKDLQESIRAAGGNFKLEPWDWWYYTEKLRAERFSFDENSLRPYFQLEKVRDAAFSVVNKLYGISFVPLQEFPKYHEDLQAFEAREADGSLIGIFLADYFMRPSKRGGAWMNAFRSQKEFAGSEYPIIVNCCNFPKASPCLLGLDEVRTLFHEFGHALHGLLSKVHYRTLSGTNVKQDFVELPSQIMEHWAMEPEVLKTFARHHETGEIISDELIEKIQEASTFNQGFATTEYLAASYLDMRWHTLESTNEQDTQEFEEAALKSINLVQEVSPRYHSSYFQHIFAGDSYSAGYYSYMWAEVLDADGYQAFKEKGLFDQETALSFRQNILEKGGTEDPMGLYVKFRGREPEVTPLLEDRGLI